VNIAEWLEYGREAGWVGDVTCAPHDGTPYTPAEAALVDDEYDDPCIFVLRIFDTGT
jgi:hypothetical protein